MALTGQVPQTLFDHEPGLVAVQARQVQLLG